eukprot:gene10396-2925_t
MNIVRMLMVFVALFAVGYYILVVKDPEISPQQKLLHYVVKLVDYRGGIMSDQFTRANLASVPKVSTNGKYKNGLLIENFNVSSTSSDRQIPVNIYVPEKKHASKRLIVQIHGGGWVKRGNTQIPAHLTTQGNTVVSIYYALAPEHPYPAAIHDCIDALKWVLSKKHDLLKDFDETKVVLVGDSAGGNLVSVLSYRVRDDEFFKYKIEKQVLVYPGIKFSGTTKSRIQYKDAYLLSLEKIDWFVKQYIQDVELFKKDPYGSVLEAKNQNNLPETLVVLAKFDPLFDEGKEYASLLKQNSNKVEVKEYPIIHGAYGIDFIKEGMNALNDSLDFINQ